jgi:SAM-dependent methyltransferase
MNPNMNINLCIMQPTGYIHSLGLLDPARYFRHQLKKMGAQVTLSKNRLQHGAINFVFGAHLEFDATQRQRHTCIFVNLEQLGAGGAAVADSYLKLLGSSAVIDYNPANVPVYTQYLDDVPIAQFFHAPYLEPENGPLPLAQRPIDLLFFGSMNERRKKIIARIEQQGISVSLFDHPVYCTERDHYIRNAKAVLNCHFYESGRFEQVRISHCLSLGTPVISERNIQTDPAPCYEDAVSWFTDDTLETFFATTFGTGDWLEQSRQQLDHFRQLDATENFAEILEFAQGYHLGHAQHISAGPWQPVRMNLGSGKDYKPGWLNVDILDRAEPDLVLDLSRPLALPSRFPSRTCGTVQLAQGQFETIHANNVLEHVPDLPGLMTQCLSLLQEGGIFEIEVPYEKALTAWQDPTHIRAMNENSWLYYTQWFWYLGWFEHRFEIDTSCYLDMQLQPCGQERAAFMRLSLKKIPTTPHERTIARTMQANWIVPDDEVANDQTNPRLAPTGRTINSSSPVSARCPVGNSGASAQVRTG